MGKTAAISTADEQEIAEARGTTVPDMLYDVGARAATTSVGQFVYKRVDNLLWTVEKTARWSLPQPPPTASTTSNKSSSSSSAAAAAAANATGEESEDLTGTNISGPPLIRPLPWLLFLPALIVLRIVRGALSMGARLVGRGPVQPATIVGFLQKTRRKLRALKYRGQRLQRIAKVEREADPKQTPTWLQRIILPLRLVICTSGSRMFDAHSDVAHTVVFRKERPATAGQRRVVSKKRNLNQREAESAEDEQASGEDSFEEAGCNDLLDKYADEEDSSFNMEDASSSGSSSDATDSSISDADPSPKKPTLESDRASEQQPKQNGQQQPPSKQETFKRSSSENKNGVESQPKPSNAASKSIHTDGRSKSAADLENGNRSGGSTAAAPNGSNTATPSKSIPNLSSSPENNENKPINQNVPVSGAASASIAAASQIKSPSPTVLAAKQSPTMSEVRTAFQQQKQMTQKQQNQQQQQQQQQLANQSSQQHPHQQQPQYVSNGAKSRNKKGPTQSVA
uniref:Uncharacterized protein n=1 Tax=Anopheles farauti TaxID=69004 RepID=A0A182QYK9_9DIPT